MRAQPLVDLVEVVARALVDEPDEVEVRRARGGGDRGTQRIELSVAPDDIGKVIGKDGRTAKSLRTLLSCAAGKVGVNRALLDILD
ncbi:MAG: KH domain-containing protein [Myxococcota bacterium]